MSEDDLLPKKPTFVESLRLYKPYILAFIILVLLLWHIFALLLGDKSVIVLLKLREQEKGLQESVKFYQRQNATLQKEIFELIGG